MKIFSKAAGLGLICAAASLAQEINHFTFDLGFGFINPVGSTGRQLNEGWNFNGGVGANFNQWLGAKLNLGYDSFGISSGTLNTIGVPDGSVSMFTVTLDPVVHLTPNGHFDVYVTGGGGLFRQQQTFTQPSSAVVPGYDPFFGFYPATIPVNQVLGSYSVNKPGIDAGMGIAVGTKWHGKIFAEAKYKRMFDGNFHTDYVPVTVGFRW
jgi:hypothetical protein